jgi:cyclophilin family peptidyl-prolyl cis-trans isomerase
MRFDRRGLCKLLGAGLLLTACAAAPGLAATPAASAAPVAKAPRVAIKTSLGTIVVVLDPVAAPISTENFLNYAKAGQYDNTLFHRVIDGFMVQGGGFDPQLHEKPAGKPIKNEANNGLKNKVGTIAMAREQAIDTATDEFFINVADNSFLDHVEVPPQGIDVTRHEQTRHIDPANADQVYGYAVFGHVVSGMDVVMKIAKQPTTTIGELENVPSKQVLIESVKVLP